MSTVADLPPAWLASFDGENLDGKTCVSAALATIGADGWPHLAFLSAGEVVIRGDRLALVLWSGSSTARALSLDGRAALFAAADGAVWETRLACTAAEDGLWETGLAFFHGHITEVRRHKAPYADVVGLVAFHLSDAPKSLARWKLQVAILRDVVAAAVPTSAPA